MAYVYNKYNQSSNATNYQNRQDEATNRYNDYANTGYTTGAGGFGGQINSAQAKLNQLYGNNNLSQQFKYGNQGAYNKAMNAVANRKPFSYDLSNDTLFQQAKEQYQNMGKVAMADTVGQASAMTGGYGNSYATTAGSQAYQGYLQQLNNDIGNYYSMALSGYNAETDRLNNIYNMYAQDRSQQQNEWSNNWNVYNNLYGLYQSELQNAQSNDSPLGIRKVQTFTTPLILRQISTVLHQAMTLTHGNRAKHCEQNRHSRRKPKGQTVLKRHTRMHSLQNRLERTKPKRLTDSLHLLKQFATTKQQKKSIHTRLKTRRHLKKVLSLGIM